MLICDLIKDPTICPFHHHFSSSFVTIREARQSPGKVWKSGGGGSVMWLALPAPGWKRVNYSAKISPPLCPSVPTALLGGGGLIADSLSTSHLNWKPYSSYEAMKIVELLIFFSSLFFLLEYFTLPPSISHERHLKKLNRVNLGPNNKQSYSEMPQVGVGACALPPKFWDII